MLHLLDSLSLRSRPRSRLPLRGRVRRPTVLTTQRQRRYSRPQRLPPRSRRALQLDPSLHHSHSRAPPSWRVHCPFVFSRLSVVPLPSFSLAIPLLCVFVLVCCRPSSPFPNFKPHSSHTGPPTAPQQPIPAAVFSDHPSAFCSCFLSRFERGFAVGFQPSRVTGLQATKPKRSSPYLPVVFVEPFLARIYNPKEATTASLLAPSKVSSSFLTCLTRASTVPALAHPQVGVSTVRSPSIAFSGL